jgi:hypothetical protein
MRDAAAGTRKWIAVASGGVLVLAAAAVVMLLLQEPGAGSATAQAPARSEHDLETRQELDRLRADLEFERLARRALAEEVALLRRALEADRAGTGRNVAALPAPEPAVESEPAAADAQANAAEKPGAAAFDAPALVTAGLPELDAERLRERWEAHELEKLELSNLALREGWQRKRLRRERFALEAGLRAELGDEWDAYLYATGKENRLRVNEVLADSAASAAGFQKGDLILSYDRQRIYNPGELRRTSAACGVGGYVSVEVIRDGNLDTLRVPCGPLGALVDHVKRPPVAP